MKIFTERELAKELGVSPWTVRLWRIKANLPYFRTAGRIFYRMESVLHWMSNEEATNTSTLCCSDSTRPSLKSS